MTSKTGEVIAENLPLGEVNIEVNRGATALVDFTKLWRVSLSEKTDKIKIFTQREKHVLPLRNLVPSTNV